ncbi:hypothetical protein ACFWM1_15525 [Nocardia sp. NPDC058379]|uniref:hypothetical protein n=1 Tax=unclassified Nocardia TaxID=2637762 RepID=UPI003666CFCE
MPSVADYLATLGHHGGAETLVDWRSAEPTQLAALKHGLMANATHAHTSTR